MVLVRSLEQVCVYGATGAGKSSLLMACLQELVTVEGRSLMNGTASYASQRAWIQNATVRLLVPQVARFLFNFGSWQMCYHLLLSTVFFLRLGINVVLRMTFSAEAMRQGSGICLVVPLFSLYFVSFCGTLEVFLCLGVLWCSVIPLLLVLSPASVLVLLCLGYVYHVTAAESL